MLNKTKKKRKNSWKISELVGKDFVLMNWNSDSWLFASSDNSWNDHTLLTAWFHSQYASMNAYKIALLSSISTHQILKEKTWLKNILLILLHVAGHSSSVLQTAIYGKKTSRSNCPNLNKWTEEEENTVNYRKESGLLKRITTT